MKLLLASLPVAGAIIVAYIPRWAEVREVRRQRYADAVEILVAWAEFPYRIARRVDDEPATMAKLVETGHEIQEALEHHRAWVTTEHPATGDLYGAVADRIREVVQPALRAAWSRPPASFPAAMNVGDLGIDQDKLRRLRTCFIRVSSQRVGFRRIRWAFGMVEPCREPELGIDWSPGPRRPA